MNLNETSFSEVVESVQQKLDYDIIELITHKIKPNIIFVEKNVNPKFISDFVKHDITIV